MLIQEAADKLGVDTQQVFVRAYKLYGLTWATHGPTEAHHVWEKEGIEPMWVKSYLRYLERKP